MQASILQLVSQDICEKDQEGGMGVVHGGFDWLKVFVRDWIAAHKAQPCPLNFLMMRAFSVHGVLVGLKGAVYVMVTRKNIYNFKYSGKLINICIYI